MSAEPASKAAAISLRLVAICGSVRRGNFTAKALHLCVDEASNHPAVAEVEVIEVSDSSLQPPGLETNAERLSSMVESVRRADGIILSTPEYHGSYSSTIKLIIDNLGFPSVLSGKAVVLLGVAAGQIGAIKALEHLRSVCSHVGALVLPGPVSVAGVQRLFDAEGRCLDAKTEQRLRGLSRKLIDYLVNTTCPDEALEETVRDPAQEAP